MTRASRGQRWASALLGLVLAAAAAVFLTADPPAPSPDAWLAADGLRAERFEVGGLGVRYVRLGSGTGRPLVLIHGIASSLFTWRDVLDGLASDREVAAIDLPGFGGSDIPETLGWEQLPSAVLGLLDHLGWERVDLVGHSMGGAVATIVAAEYPGRVDRLVLVDAAGFHLAPEHRPWVLRVLGHPLAGPFEEHWPWRRAVVRLGLKQVFHDDARVTDARVDAYWAASARPRAGAALRALLSESHELPFAAMARAVDAPTLVVWGREDAWIPFADGTRFVDTIPRARLAIIDGCGHIPQEETPERFLSLVEPFLSRL